MKWIGPLIFILSAMLLQGCLKCKGDDKSEGLIIREVPELSCLSVSDGGFALCAQHELDSIAQGLSLQCDSLPIDFNQNCLLGFYCTGSCHMKVIRRVEFDDANMKCIYTLRVYDCGCWYKVLKVYYNLVLIPKIPPGYTVEFRKIEE